MSNEDNPITYFAQTNYREVRTPFGIKLNDRFMHTYIIGKTGVGKSSLLKYKLMQDVNFGFGCTLIDPHGDLAEEIKTLIPKHRLDDVIYFDLNDRSIPYRYNPLKKVSYEKRSLVASGILEILQKLWKDAWGVKLEHILRFSILTLLDQPKATFEDIPKLLLDKTFRRNAVKYVVNKNIRLFWEKEYPRYLRNDILPVLNKVGAFLVHPVIRRVLIDNEEELSLRKIMDDNSILIVNLAKGQVGQDVANVIGSLLVTSIGSAAFTQVDMEERLRVPHFMYLDEFHHFTTLSLVNMLSELRKFKLGMILAHQYLNQIDKDIKSAVIGNVGTLISFRVGTDDASVMAREMYPIFTMEDLIRLPNYQIFLKLMIDGTPSRPFSAETLPYVQNDDSIPLE